MAKGAALRSLAVAVAFATALTMSVGAQAQSATEDHSYWIMKPELWLAPKYKSPRGLPQKPNTAHTQPRSRPRSSVGVAPAAPPITLPSGQVVPNVPPVNQGAVPGGGRETFGDRAARCAHQSGLYGVPADQQGTYMNSCTGQ